MDIEKFMLEFLKENNYEITEDNNFKYFIYDNSDKCMSKEDLSKIFYSKNPNDKFYEIVFELYDEYEQINYFIDTIKYTYPNIYKEFSNEIEEWTTKHINIEYPIEYFLNYKYLTDIVIDTGDGNFDYTLNCIPQYNKNIENEASIVWLARVNGYSKKQLENAVKNEELNKSKFLKSVFEELSNCSSQMNALVFFVEMTLKELIDMYNYQNIKYIKISQNTKVGLCDFCCGAGGLLGIHLEKDIVIPTKYINSCLPDKMQRYGVKDIYGINDTLWKYGKVIEIRKEN